MVVTIDNKQLNIKEGTTILEAAKSAGVKIPTLCYMKDICEVGACRVCLVEIEGDDRLSAACNMVAENGMIIHTNSRRVLDARRVNVELALSAHNMNCTTCSRNLNCTLQTIANELNIADVPYENKPRHDKWPEDFPLIRDSSKCVSCMRCINICDKLQSLGVWNTRGAAAHLNVNVAGGKAITESDCSLCGQCVTGCPVGALSARDDTAKVFDAIYDPEKVVVVQVAPAVRAAWAEEYDGASAGQMVAAVRALGVDYVFDTGFAADLTVMEEGNELLQRVKETHSMPLLSSCCPGWVRFAKSQYPELVPHLSTAKSPQQMFGAITKTWFANRSEIDPAKVFSVSIMPCIAKKHECALPGMSSTEHGQDVDAVITSREFMRMLKTRNINVCTLAGENFDDPLGTGVSVIFGTSGGVTESVLRSAHYFVTGSNPQPDAFSALRATSNLCETTIDLNGTPIRIAVVSGLAAARELIEKIKTGKAAYDFVEVMACPGGCVCGGGQPIYSDFETTPERAPVLRDVDKGATNRLPHDNPAIKKVYDEFLKQPLSDKAHELLHTDHGLWNMR